MSQAEGYSFDVPVRNLKRDWLLLPAQLVEALDIGTKRVAVLLEDDSGRNYAAVIDGERMALGGGNLGAWFRTHRRDSAPCIRIEVLNATEKHLRMIIPQTKGLDSSGLHLGWRWNMVGGEKAELGQPYYLPPSNLLTHTFVCGATGSGKTVFAKALLEEALLRRIPAVVIDLKGDVSSMGLIIDRDEPNILLPWQQGETEAQRRQRASEALSAHMAQLREQGLDLQKARRLKQEVSLRILTPRRPRGIQLGFPAALGAPDDAVTLAEQQEAEFKELVRAQTDAFLDRLYPKTARTKIENERNFLFEIVAWCWRYGVDLSGIEGLEVLLREIQNPPFDLIGGLPVSQYIDAENRRSRLLNKVNTLISGPEILWFQGEPLTPELLLKPEKGGVPLSIINLSEVDQFEDRSFIVSQVAHTIGNWMRRQPGSNQPRILFFIDEIGGGGGREALFPSYPYQCAAKWGLNYLVRQGRTFGVCCVFATQNPGDIDYRALGNCGVWVVGRLGTRLDRQKAMESIGLPGRERQWTDRFVTRAQPGDFVVRSPGDTAYIHGRSVFSYHREMAPQELSELLSRF